MARKRRARSLANRYTKVAVLVVVLITILLGSTVILGVLRMAQAEALARQDAHREVIQREIFGRIQASQRVVRALTDRTALTTGAPAEVQRLLGTTFYGNAGYLSRIMVIETSGTVVAAYPPERAQDPEEVSVVAGVMRDKSTPPFAWVPSTEDGGGSLWSAVALGSASGASRVLLADVRMDFLGETLSSVPFANAAAAALVIDASSGEVIGSSGMAAVEEAEEWRFQPSADDRSRGTVDVTVGADQRYAGVFGQVPGLADLGWRVVVVEPSTAAVGRTLGALRPAIAAWAVAVLVVLGATVASFSWLLRPLRELEKRTAAVASGASLGVVEMRRDDEVGRLWRSFNSLTSRVTELRDVSNLLARSYDRDTVLDGILTSLGRTFDGRDAAVLLLDKSSQVARVARGSGSLARREGSIIRVTDSPWLSAALSSSEVIPFDSQRMSDDPVIALHPGGLRRHSGVLVPMMMGLRRLGMLAIFFPARKPLGEQENEFEIVRSFASQAAIALDNARLFEEERASRERAQALQRVAELLTRPTDLRRALDEAAAIAAGLLGFETGVVMLSDPEVFGSSAADDSEAERTCSALGDRGAFPGTGTPESADVATWLQGDADVAVAACLEAIGAESALASPLRYSGGLAGLLVLGTRGELPILAEPDFAAASAIATASGLALENAYLFEQVRNRADNLETIFRISQAVSSSLQTRVVLNRVLDVVQRVFSADAVLLMSFDAVRGTMTVPMARGLIDPAMIAMEFPPGADIPGSVFESRTALRIDDLGTYDTPLAHAARAQGLGSALAVPLLARGRSIGVACIFSREGAAFPHEDLELLSTFAVQAALAIDNAELFGREHHVASVLQRSIRPATLPAIPGIASFSLYRAAGEAVEIGGDYYDLFSAPDGRVVMAIGDVCGSGIEAATKTSMLKYSVRSLVAAGLGPAGIVGRINGMIVEGGDPADIVTLWLGVLDTQSGELAWANGGHPPALLLESQNGGRIHRLEATGALLGAVAGAEYLEERVTIPAGGTLLLYTDGVTEARNPTGFFGEGRVRRVLRKGGSARQITERLLSAVERFSQTEIKDDVAILTVAMIGHRGESDVPVTPSASAGIVS
jgi:GAF domain-containing protein